MIYESTRKMSVKEQEAYDLGYLNGKEAALRRPDPDTGNVGKRVQGCWYCNDDVMQVVDSPNKPPINATYCGLCGRKLEVEG